MNTLWNNNKYITILEPFENVEMKFKIQMLSRFGLPYCMTCHSVQRLTIDDKITILIVIFLM